MRAVRRACLASAFGAFGSLLGVQLRRCLGGRGLGGVLDQERRLQKFLDERVLGHHLAELGAGGQGPVDAALGALRIDEAERPGVVLLVLHQLAQRFEIELIDPLSQFGAQQGQLGRNLALGFGGEIGAV